MAPRQGEVAPMLPPGPKMVSGLSGLPVALRGIGVSYQSGRAGGKLHPGLPGGVRAL